jgi:hypothetical protein
MSPDSVSLVEAIQKGIWYEGSSISYMAFIKLTSLGGDFIWLSAIIQCCLVNFAVVNLIKRFKPKFSLLQILICVSILGLFPHLGAMQNTIWKDVPFASLSIIGLLILTSKRKESLVWQLAGILILGAAYSFRLEGPVDLVLIVVITTAVYLVNCRFNIITKDVIKPKLIINLLLSLAVSLGISVSSPLLVDAEKSTTAGKVYGQILDLVYTYSSDPYKLSNNTKKLLESFANEEALSAGSDCRIGDPFIFNSGFNQIIAGEESGAIFKSWITESIRNPSIFVKPRLCRNARFLPFPISSGPGYPHWLMTGIYTPNSIYLSPLNSESWISKKVLSWQNFWEINWKWTTWIGLHFQLLFLYLLFHIRRESILVIFVIAGLARLLSIFLFTAAQDSRYALIVEITALTVLVTTVVGRLSPEEKRRNKKMKSR